MRNKSLNELNYIELHNGNIICLEDITDMNIRGLLLEKSDSFTIL